MAYPDIHFNKLLYNVGKTDIYLIVYTHTQLLIIDNYRRSYFTIVIQKQLFYIR